MPRELYLIAQNIRSLYNLGSLFRSSDIFGVIKIYLTGYTGYTGKHQKNNFTERQLKQISKTALGAENYIDWQKHWHTHTLIHQLKIKNVNIYAIECHSQGKNIQTFKPNFPCALIVGNEKRGVSPKVLKLSDKILYIPMQGKKESLNVASSAAIALYEFSKYK